MSTTTPPPVPEIDSLAKARVLDGVFSKLWTIAEGLRQEVKELREGWDKAAADAAVKETEYKRIIEQQRRDLDDLAQREFRLQEELNTCHAEMGGLRAELNGAKFHFQNAIERAEDYITPRAGVHDFGPRVSRKQSEDAAALNAVAAALQAAEETPGATVADIVIERAEPSDNAK